MPNLWESLELDELRFFESDMLKLIESLELDELRLFESDMLKLIENLELDELRLFESDMLKLIENLELDELMLFESDMLSLIELLLTYDQRRSYEVHLLGSMIFLFLQGPSLRTTTDGCHQLQPQAENVYDQCMLFWLGGKLLYTYSEFFYMLTNRLGIESVSLYSTDVPFFATTFVGLNSTSTYFCNWCVQCVKEHVV